MSFCFPPKDLRRQPMLHDFFKCRPAGDGGEYDVDGI